MYKSCAHVVVSERFTESGPKNRSRAVWTKWEKLNTKSCMVRNDHLNFLSKASSFSSRSCNKGTLPSALHSSIHNTEVPFQILYFFMAPFSCWIWHNPYRTLTHFRWFLILVLRHQIYEGQRSSIPLCSIPIRYWYHASMDIWYRYDTDIFQL